MLVFSCPLADSLLFSWSSGPLLIVKYSYLILRVRRGASPSLALRVQSQHSTTRRVPSAFRPCSSGPRSPRVYLLLFQSVLIERGESNQDFIERARVEYRVLMRLFESRTRVARGHVFRFRKARDSNRRPYILPLREVNGGLRFRNST